MPPDTIPEHVAKAREISAAEDEGAKRAGEAGRAIDEAANPGVRCSFCQIKTDGIAIQADSGAVICHVCITQAAYLVNDHKAKMNRKK